MATLGVPRRYIPQGRADEILASLDLDAKGIAGSVRRALRDASRAALAGHEAADLGAEESGA